LQNVLNNVTGNGSGGGNVVNNILNNAGKPMSQADIIKGLKEALSVGTNNSSSKAAAVDGFFKNSLIKIPFPQNIKKVENTMNNIGMKPAVDKFVETLNRAAEKAAKDAAPIFLNAITGITINDGLQILKGENNAATNFLSSRTNNELKLKFLPVVKNALNAVQITKYWNPIMNKYNQLPLVQKVNPNLEDYVTGKAIEGLFKLIAQEEDKIRKDPKSRITELLKLVFG
jgi:hypothetical protein